MTGATPGTTHLVLTRFNVRWIIGPHDTDWLAHRFDLFDRYCFPSVHGQTSHDFRWLVFFDEDTPEPFRSRIADYARWPVFTPVFIGRPSSEVYDGAIAAHLDGADHLITTRLDNDDAIGRDFVARVRTAARPGPREFLNLPVGYVWHKGRLYRHEHPSNAFISLAEPAAGFRSVWGNQHEDAARIAPVRQVSGGPSWLQVIHEHNVSNRVRGRRYPVSRLRDEFAIDLGRHPADESAADYWFDRSVRHPARVARDGAFRLAKPVRDVLERATTAVRDR
ncbi:MAG TPA: glycosyltransferase [Acidimicrobiales bacterium]|nr:glycosyltransferase [Acidimicrobiales bacterium]